MNWSRDFTELILDFATHAARVDGISLDDALLKSTPLYPNLSLGTAFDPSKPLWQEFVTGVQTAEDRLGWAHAFYVAHARQYHPHPFGCFEYHYDPETRTISLHFGNLDSSREGALSPQRRSERLKELRALFEDVRHRHPEAEMVHGGSWLYNLDGYKALFPSEYVANSRPTRPGLTYLDVWGQFLDGDWELRAEPARVFRRRLAEAQSHADLEASFPYWPLSVRGPIDLHYRLYGIV